MVLEHKNFNNIIDILGTKTRVKIIHYLTNAPHNELNISKLTELCKTNHGLMQENLEFLKKAGIVQERNFGRIRIFRLISENYKVKHLKNAFETWNQ